MSTPATVNSRCQGQTNACNNDSAEGKIIRCKILSAIFAITGAALLAAAGITGPAYLTGIGCIVICWAVVSYVVAYRFNVRRSQVYRAQHNYSSTTNRNNIIISSHPQQTTSPTNSNQTRPQSGQYQYATQYPSFPQVGDNMPAPPPSYDDAMKGSKNDAFV